MKNFNTKDINNFFNFVNEKKIEENRSILKIENQKTLIIKEEVINNIDKKEKQQVNTDYENLNFIDKIKSTNDAENILLDSFLKSFNISDFTKKWMGFISLVDNLSKIKDPKKSADVFFDMLDLSSKYFGRINDELKNNIQNLNNPQNDVTQNASQTLEKSYGYRPVPTDIAEKAWLDFEMLCTTNAVYIGSYLTLFELIFKQNDIITYLLKNYNNTSHVFTLIGQLKNEMSQKNILTNKKAISKFEEIQKNISKSFEKSSGTISHIEVSRKKLFNSFEVINKSINEFCDNLTEDIKNFKKLSDLELYQKLFEAAEKHQEQIEKMSDKLYNDFKPELLLLKKNFDNVLENLRIELDTNYGEILKKLNKKPINAIYNENKEKFNQSYTSCMNYIGENFESGKLINHLTAAKESQNYFKDKIEELSAKQKEQKELQTDDKAVLKINNMDDANLNQVMPIQINND